MNPLCLAIPTSFLRESDYPHENKNYYSSHAQAKLFKKTLLKASKGYCMYCGRIVSVDGEDVSQIEHAVDKRGNDNQSKDDDTFLSNCKYNLGIACPNCNMIYKKSIRKIDLQGRQEKCPEKTCDEKCDLYLDAWIEYIGMNYLILQPLGYEENGEKCSITYDLLGQYYEPAYYMRNEHLKFLTTNHIQQFCLNCERVPLTILDICEEIIQLSEMGVNDMKAVYEFLNNQRYPNYLGILFMEWVKEYFIDIQKEFVELVEFCKLEIILSTLF